ncbi:nicotinate (nicotinamide) nucleotide adenylyltransferase [Apibacter sp. wkB309]|uniref:nicotinate (nicotinamide) nucleotide adenylyltransferase n=1 Tax=Apibacter sp. wkB309 TaxID=1679467 RepID=UPI000CF8F86D|nr:nicotinate (nicotinamide) nucleotide adenylyltransferase [Apibacter sp. wkB309]PQL92996.1 nicotinic acid mononucleotide adenylyltransferase [Apibacter sp. wkB309]
MKVGLFFGSFNPIHIGHLIIANYIIENSDLTQIWFVVTPQNPFKNKSTLLKDHHRLEMVNLAIEKYPHFRSSSVEFTLPKPSYTIDTLVVLKEKYPSYDFVLLMGEDNLNSFHKWKNYEQILKYHSLFVYPRMNRIQNEQTMDHPHIHKISAPIIEISSTLIRSMIKEHKNVRPMLPPEVFNYIDGSNLYK